MSRWAKCVLLGIDLRGDGPACATRIVGPGAGEAIGAAGARRHRRPLTQEELCELVELVAIAQRARRPARYNSPA